MPVRVTPVIEVMSILLLILAAGSLTIGQFRLSRLQEEIDDQRSDPPS